MHKEIQLALITGALLASSCAYSREYCTETYVDNTGKHTCLSTNLRSNLPSGNAFSDPLTVEERNANRLARQKELNANRLAKQKELATQQKARIKQTCLEFGFSEGTTEFASCQLDLYKLELAQGQNTQMLETIDKNAAAERAQAKKLAVEERAQIQKLADEQEARRKSQAMGAALLGISKSLLTPPPQPERYDTDCTTYGNNTDCTTRRR